MVLVGTRAARLERLQGSADAVGRGLELLARGAVDVGPLITHHFRLQDFEEAWTTFVERRDGAIRVMLHP